MVREIGVCENYNKHTKIREVGSQTKKKSEKGTRFFQIRKWRTTGKITRKRLKKIHRISAKLQLIFGANRRFISKSTAFLHLRHFCGEYHLYLT